jgi:PleD family two-component response regulator
MHSEPGAVRGRAAGASMKRADFADLRVMLVGPKSHSLSLLRSVLATAGITRVVQVERTDRALELLRMDPFGVVFHGAPQKPEEMPFTLAVRRAPAMLNPMIPIFLVGDRVRRRDVEKARDLGATDVLTLPISTRTVITKLSAALSAPRPFIVAPDFFGPDRRAKRREGFAGRERRVRAPRKTRVEFTLI